MEWQKKHSYISIFIAAVGLLITVILLFKPNQNIEKPNQNIAKTSQTRSLKIDVVTHSVRLPKTLPFDDFVTKMQCRSNRTRDTF